MTNQNETSADRVQQIAKPSNGETPSVNEVSEALNTLLADVFALYLKTKNFHWHMGGPHFRDYHLLLDDHADQLFAMTDDIAERVRKIGGTTVRSIGHTLVCSGFLDNDADFVTPIEMLKELRDNEKTTTANMHEAHAMCDDAGAPIVPRHH